MVFKERLNSVWGCLKHGCFSNVPQKNRAVSFEKQGKMFIFGANLQIKDTTDGK